jgi:ribonuclease J
MHGEHRHLREHVKLAGENDYPGVLAVNGTMVDIGAGQPVEFIETGRVYLDGRAHVGQFDGIIRDRICMALNGHVTVTLILDEENEPLGDPWCELMGLPETGRNNADLVETLENALGGWLQRADAKVLRDDETLEKDLRILCRRTTENEIGKKPEVTVVISRLS